MLKRFLCLIATAVFVTITIAQDKTASGILTGNVIDEGKKPVEGASSEIILLTDSAKSQSVLTDKDGSFSFQNIEYGYYRLRITYVGFQPLIIDSIYFRSDRADFNLSDLLLKSKSAESLGEVIIYAEKPLIQSKDGNITFNAAESALSAGSNASDLLTNVPLVTKDPEGKITVRGKEPKILIDDKPVELNLQQLQDLLESMPGSSIEKIEVMTNPPPQYANEQGGVINIVTKKGKVGKTGRLNLSGGTRGEASINGNYTYRKQGLAMSLNAGVGYSRYWGDGYSVRNNIYADSSNQFNTKSNYTNKSLRPNFRFNMDYDLTRLQSINVVLQLNSNDYLNTNFTEYSNVNQFSELYKISDRAIHTDGKNYNGSMSFSYLLKTRVPGEQLRVLLTSNISKNNSDRDFYQQYFYGDHSPTGIDSTQQQLNNTRNEGHVLRADYDRPLFNRKTFLSLGSYYNRSNSDVDVDASYLKKPEDIFVVSDLLSNNFRFHQTVINFRSSLKQIIAPNFSATAGLSLEQTNIWFELLKDNRDAKNQYWTWLPFANINKSWKEKLTLTLAYRRSIRRPGINELNPTIDFSDPYNIRFGNAKLQASTADNFDLVVGRSKTGSFINLGLGYNLVKDIYSRVRTLLPDGKTQITWENISGRKEYEVSTWGGLTFTRKLRVNLSASYTYNQYSDFDRVYNRYRNGGSFTSNINSTFTPRDVWNFIGSFTFNRFANPQGYARWAWSMNTGIQRKFLDKRFIVTLNLIDIFSQQRSRSYTYASNFRLESYSQTYTRNIRLTLAYNFTKVPKKKPLVIPGKK